jgi:hypothetical protein
MSRVTSIKKLSHSRYADKIELIVNNKRTIVFDFMINEDSVEGIFYELNLEFNESFANIDIIMRDLLIIIKSIRITTIMYD